MVSRSPESQFIAGRQLEMEETLLVSQRGPTRKVDALTLWQNDEESGNMVSSRAILKTACS